MTDERITRRRVLRGTAAAGVAATTGLSGCSAVTGLLGGGGNYVDWLHEPGALTDRDHYSFLALTPTTIAENDDEIDDRLYDFLTRVEHDWEPTGVDFDEMSQYVSTSAATVVATDVDGEEIIDDLESENYDDEDTYEGYEVYLSEDERTAFGVSGGWVVKGGDDGLEDPVDTVEIAVDTQNGDEDRYVEESDAFQELTDALGDGTYVSGSTHEERESTSTDSGRFQGSVASGFNWQVNGEESQITYAIVFADADDIDSDDIEDWVDHSDDFDNVEEPEINLNGRTVVVNAVGDTDDIGT